MVQLNMSNPQSTSKATRVVVHEKNINKTNIKQIYAYMFDTERVCLFDQIGTAVALQCGM